YGMPKQSANLNHLAYADDTIIFASSHDYSLGNIMVVLQDYEKQSGQKHDVHTYHPMRDIKEFLTEEGWDFVALQDAVPEDVVDHIRHNMSFVQPGEQGDKPTLVD
ncbi:hypothetical protein H5410_015522, partial [Solanum commersonii]